MRFIFFFLFLTSVTQAHVLVRAPGASPKLYQQYLQKNPKMQSMITNLRTEMRNSKEGEVELQAFSDRSDFKLQELLNFISQLRSDKVLSRMAWQFLGDLIKSRQSDWTRDFKKVEPLLCEALFYSEQEELPSCRWRPVNFDEFKAQWPEAEGIFIENRFFELKGTVMIPNSQAVQWKIVSNTTHPQTFWGTQQDLQRLQQSGTYFVEGQCAAFQSTSERMTFLTTSVYFSDDCVESLQKEERELHKDSWIARNKSWLIPFGIALTAGAALGLKDKNLVINKSGFK